MEIPTIGKTNLTKRILISGVRYVGIFSLCLFLSSKISAQSFEKKIYYGKWEITSELGLVSHFGERQIKNGKVIIDEQRVFLKDTLLFEAIFVTIGVTVPKDGDPFPFIQLSFPYSKEWLFITDPGEFK